MRLVFVNCKDGFVGASNVQRFFKVAIEACGGIFEHWAFGLVDREPLGKEGSSSHNFTMQVAEVASQAAKKSWKKSEERTLYTGCKYT